jgi:hypothetical protein
MTDRRGQASDLFGGEFVGHGGLRVGAERAIAGRIDTILEGVV